MHMSNRQNMDSLIKDLPTETPSSNFIYGFSAQSIRDAKSYTYEKMKTKYNIDVYNIKDNVTGKQVKIYINPKSPIDAVIKRNHYKHVDKDTGKEIETTDVTAEIFYSVCGDDNAYKEAVAMREILDSVKDKIFESKKLRSDATYVPKLYIYNNVVTIIAKVVSSGAFSTKFHILGKEVLIGNDDIYMFKGSCSITLGNSFVKNNCDRIVLTDFIVTSKIGGMSSEVVTTNNIVSEDISSAKLF